jgi:hypothetical protein
MQIVGGESAVDLKRETCLHQAGRAFNQTVERSGSVSEGVVGGLIRVIQTQADSGYPGGFQGSS